MRDPTSGISMWSLLAAFQKSLPVLIDEECVEQYHKILESLEKDTNISLRDFRIESSCFAFRIAVAQTVDSYRPRPIQYTNKRYCDSDHFFQKLEGLQHFLNQAKKNNP